ncbi:MAG: Holliday junction branch migration protein RuvA [Candidatus Neomarinimicrobiota bacterium]|jgi:Holliday junction DNA helicase RuvA|nr:Holliday junction branch migration protein RuvA [Candidatus Neomarinimicrobiota bacterium]MEE2632520.1 Holliday junction branch migration protein RuvA [Candidatus Neomarinimicrobiota bacterium]|tara:strand:+ start:773 stop:1366 length:594 start_codon:yes stop_codon:yes gene_type:complete
MIDSIHGIIEKKEPTNLFIKLNGFVFNISICIRDYEKLPSVGKKIDVLTYLNVRENLMELYGFLSKERRDLFIQLILVSGIGPRTAINLLSNVSVQNFKENIITEDIQSLSLIPGIGPKTAKRIVIEIKEKITFDSSSKRALDTSKINFNVDDIYTALSSLGYKKSQIDKSIKKLNDSNSFEGNIEDVIKKILSTIR